jgi:hypothetical protein
LEFAWSWSEIDGWKTDWLKAARHVFLSFVTGESISDTRELPQNYAVEIVDWLREETQLKKSNLARLLRDEMDDAVMAEAERHAIEHNRQYYRRERIMFLAKDPV